MHTLLEPGEKGFLLTDIGRLIYKVFERDASRLGYTRAHWQVLAHLSNNPGLTQVALANPMEIEPITLSRHIDRLEAQGIVERRSDRQDRRVKRLFLTDNATPQLKEIQQVRDNVLNALFAGVAPEQESMFRHILTNIRNNLIRKLG